MMGSTFSRGGGSVRSDAITMTITQKHQETIARSKYTPGMSQSSTGVAAKPRMIVASAPTVLARRQSKPAQKITENGGAIQKKTFCTFKNSGTLGVRLKYHAIVALAIRKIVPPIWPKRTCCCSVDSGRMS